MASIADGNVIWKKRKRNWCGTPFTLTTYTLTDKELLVQSGLLHIDYDLTKLFRIVDMDVCRKFPSMLFGLATIRLYVRDESAMEGTRRRMRENGNADHSGLGIVELKNITGWKQARIDIQHAIDASRSENKVYAREFMGGDADRDGDGYHDDAPDGGEY